MKPIAFLALTLSMAVRAGEFAPMDSPAVIGQTFVTQFVSAPFPHSSRTNGHKYKDEFFPADKNYSDSSVSVFIPNGFGNESSVDFVIHFHGWRNTTTGAMEQFKLREQLIASHRNAILIVPQGPQNAPDSSGGKLEDVDGFKRFMDETMLTLKQRGTINKDAHVGQIILSGHSGGYQVMSSIVERGGLSDEIKEVWLFDGLYAQEEKFLAWSQKTGGRLVNIYTDNGGTKARTEEMFYLLKQRGSNVLVTTDAAISIADLSTNRFVFLHTDMSHNDVLEKRRTFQKFLETSCLKEKPSK